MTIYIPKINGGLCSVASLLTYMVLTNENVNEEIIKNIMKNVDCDKLNEFIEFSQEDVKYVLSTLKDDVELYYQGFLHQNTDMSKINEKYNNENVLNVVRYIIDFCCPLLRNFDIPNDKPCYIVHFDNVHYTCIGKINDKWYNFDTLFNEPQII
jgi:hypothetical protein